MLLFRRYPTDPKLGPFVQNASLIWCALSNWGGAVVLGGDLTLALTEARAAIASESPRTVGVGLTPEGIDNSNAYFSIVLDAPWEEVNAPIDDDRHVDILKGGETTAAATLSSHTVTSTTKNLFSAEEWFVEWGHGRCGRSDVTAAEQAYAKLYRTVYRPKAGYLWCCSQPYYCPTMLPTEDDKKKAYRPTWNATELRAALALMVKAAPLCNTSTFLFDLVDVAREWLSSTPCLTALDAVNMTVRHTAPATFKAEVKAFRDVQADIDAMMASDPGKGFLLGEWLKQSRAVADWDGSNTTLADFYEWNSRIQITSWAGGYSRREWSGVGTSCAVSFSSLIVCSPRDCSRTHSRHFVCESLLLSFFFFFFFFLIVDQYYGGRVDAWAACGLDPTCTSMNDAVNEFSSRWVNETWDPVKLPATPVGDPVALAKRLLKKYS